MVYLLYPTRVLDVLCLRLLWTWCLTLGCICAWHEETLWDPRDPNYCGLQRCRMGAVNLIQSQRNTYMLLVHTHTYIHTYVRTYVHTYIPTYIHTYLHTYIPTCLHAYIPTYLHTYIPTYLHACIASYFPVWVTHFIPHSKYSNVITYIYSNRPKKIESMSPGFWRVQLLDLFGLLCTLGRPALHPREWGKCTHFMGILMGHDIWVYIYTYLYIQVCKLGMIRVSLKVGYTV